MLPFSELDGLLQFERLHEKIFTNLTGHLGGLLAPAERVTRLGGVPHLSCKRDHDKKRDYKNSGIYHFAGLPHPPGVPMHLHVIVNRP